MKLLSLLIENYFQFDKVFFDFTYPPGHEKAGAALDKVCFIGQSGTGKTTILNLILDLLSRKVDLHGNSIIQARLFNDKLAKDEELLIFKKNQKINYRLVTRLQKIMLPIDSVVLNRISTEYFTSQDVLAMYLPSDFLVKNKDEEIILRDSSSNIYNFNNVNVRNIWFRILDEIKQNKDREIIVRKKLEKLYTVSNKGYEELEREREPLQKELKFLLDKDTNPLKILANECLDMILGHFGLSVDTEFSVSEDISKIDFIRIKDKTGKIIPNGLLSSGTSQFILSSLPFYLLQPNDAVILFDEPERSFYPNIQKLLVDHYQKFTSNSQFFYATHSPIIASCFEPWEVFELIFNDEGNVAIKPYYEGERIVENYKVHPKYLTYELILKEFFQVTNTNGDERVEKLTELLMLDEQLKDYKQKNDNSSLGYKTTLKRYKQIGELLSWPIKFVE